MDPVNCGHKTCFCTVSSASPDPYCSTWCRDHEKHHGRCQCGHDACAGVEGEAVKDVPSALRPETIQGVIEGLGESETQ